MFYSENPTFTGDFITFKIILQRSDLYSVHRLCILLLTVEIKTAAGHGSETPSFRVKRHINSFILSTSSRLPSSSFNFCYCPSRFLLASPFVAFFTTTLIVFNGLPLEGQPSQLFVSPSHCARRQNKMK
jgi:hypothetical protein